MTKQKPNSVYVTVRDGMSGKSRTMTIYGTSRDTVMTEIERAISGPTQTSGEEVGTDTEEVMTGKVAVASRSGPNALQSATGQQ